MIETEYIPYDDYNSKVCEEPIMPTLTTNCGSSALRNGSKVIEASILEMFDQKYLDFIYQVGSEYWLVLIRKLIPKECWRLMGFTDEDFEKAEKVVSNTQLYKQAGNSIVVNCLEGIFRGMIG